MDTPDWIQLGIIAAVFVILVLIIYSWMMWEWYVTLGIILVIFCAAYLLNKRIKL